MNNKCIVSTVSFLVQYVPVCEHNLCAYNQIICVIPHIKYCPVQCKRDKDKILHCFKRAESIFAGTVNHHTYTSQGTIKKRRISEILALTHNIFSVLNSDRSLAEIKLSYCQKTEGSL